MNLKSLYFSTDGRVNRARFWLGNLPFMVLLVLGLLLDAADVAKGSLTPFGFYAFAGLIYLLPGLALSVKRCHDRDHSGWFILLNLIPILSLWYAVEIGFLPGAQGPNRFGPDPLDPENGLSEDKEDSRTQVLISRLTESTEPAALAGAAVTPTDSALTVYTQCDLNSPLVGAQKLVHILHRV